VATIVRVPPATAALREGHRLLHRGGAVVDARQQVAVQVDHGGRG
jgi:hypothetical protein